MIKVGDKVEFQDKVCLVIEIESNESLIVQPYRGNKECRFSVTAPQVNKIINEGSTEFYNKEGLNG